MLPVPVWRWRVNSSRFPVEAQRSGAALFGAIAPGSGPRQPRAHAEVAGSDECWVGNGMYGNACKHVFKDGTKCVVFSRMNGSSSSTGTTVMDCKFP